MGDVIQFPVKKELKLERIKDRYQSCIEIMRNTNKLCTCNYCNYIKFKGKNLALAMETVLKKDEVKNNLELCMNDAKLILWEAYNQINGSDIIQGSTDGK